jgi:hypothetical protein
MSSGDIHEFLHNRRYQPSTKPWYWQQYDQRGLYRTITPNTETLDIHTPGYILKKFTPDGKVA